MSESISAKAPLVFFPRGFSLTPISPTMEVTTSGGDQEIETLYRLYTARSVNTESWEFRKRVITAGARLHGDLYAWLAYQAAFNNRVYGLNFDFIEDTIKFIQTGRRSVNIISWYELLMEFPNEIVGSANVRRLRGLNIDDEARSLSTSGVGRWLAHSSGFDDYMMTLNILFGSPKKTRLVKKI